MAEERKVVADKLASARDRMTWHDVPTRVLCGRWSRRLGPPSPTATGTG